MKLKSLLATHCHPISFFLPRGKHYNGLKCPFLDYLKTCKYINRYPQEIYGTVVSNNENLVFSFPAVIDIQFLY